MEARLENKHNSRANRCNKNHNRLYGDSMIEFELEFNIAVEIILKNTHCMPPWGTSYTVAGPLKPPTMTSLPVGTEVAVTTSTEKRTRARVKKEENFNIIISDEDWIVSSKGKERREILVECNHLKLIYKSKENEYTWKSPPPSCHLGNLPYRQDAEKEKDMETDLPYQGTCQVTGSSVPVSHCTTTNKICCATSLCIPIQFLDLIFWDYRQSALAGSMLSWGGRILAGGSSVWGRLG